MEAYHIAVGGAQVTLQNVRLREDIRIDEVRLEGANMTADSDGVGGTRANLGEVIFRIVISETNLNRLIVANLAANAPLKNLSIALFSGRAKLSGNVVKSFLSLPFAVEASILIRNGIELYFDLTGLKLGVALPASVTEVVEGHLNRILSDIAKDAYAQAPCPIQLQEALCEPGRLTLKGKAKIELPLEPPAAP